LYSFSSEQFSIYQLRLSIAFSLVIMSHEQEQLPTRPPFKQYLILHHYRTHTHPTY